MVKSNNRSKQVTPVKQVRQIFDLNEFSNKIEMNNMFDCFVFDG